MTRTRGALLSVAVLLAAIVGVVLFTMSHHRAQPQVVLPRPQDAAQLATAQTFIDHLAVPAAAQRDPYDSVCRVTTTFCVTSTTLTESDLVSRVTDRIVAAGAQQSKLFSSCRVRSPTVVNCTIRFDVDGARVEIRGGPGPYVALIPADVPDSQAPQGKALGPWSKVNPLPARWVSTATCEKTLPDGCQWYDSDEAGQQNRPSVPGTLPIRYAQARQALIAQGFVVDNQRCVAAVNGSGACLLSGFQYRSLGGHDGEGVQVILRAADSANVTIEVHVSSR